MHEIRFLSRVLTGTLIFSACALAATSYQPFLITIKDASTGRGIPLVELKTTHKLRLYSDVEGRIAFYEPGLMDQEVFFHVSGSDFEMRADGFGYKGKAFKVTENGQAEMRLDRVESGRSGFWLFDEGSGDTVSDWMHNRSGTLEGGVTWRRSGGITAAAQDHALGFDGIDDYVRLPRTIESDFSVAFHLKTTQNAPDGSQWYNGSGLIDADIAGAANDFGISLNGGRICFGVGNPDTSIRSATAVNDGHWHFVVATRQRKSGKITLYIDGIEEAWAIAGKNNLNASAEINIGRQQTGGNYFAGTIDRLMIFDHTLSGAEVYALHNPAFVPATHTIEPFVIRVTDASTGRGVPMVSLRADCGPELITDSAGVVAIYEPPFMNRRVRFSVFSHGYKTPADGFSAEVKPNGQAEFSIERTNIAERLYRITGAGIYHHSTLAGLDVPLKNPNLTGKVMGQDTVAMTRYKGQYHWLWGDTDRPAYPLGNFKTSGAVSPVPDAGGLHPETGIDLTYFTDQSGFSKQMFPRDDAGLVWMGTMNTVSDGGAEYLIASYAAMRGADQEVFERGFAVFNDTSQQWKRTIRFAQEHRIQPSGHAYKHTDEYIYVTQPYPVIRFWANPAFVSRPETYEGFTCLLPGTAFEGEHTTVERDSTGRLVWGWKRNTAILNDNQWKKLVDSQIVKPDEEFSRFYDIDTGEHVFNHGGSVAYNAYRNCWVMIFLQAWAKPSFLGEVWYAEAPSPQGPWKRAVKIISHDHYTFYNVQAHPEFDQQGGRCIYLEGTYVTTYSGNPIPTPRYDYNQIMYRLDLDHPEIRGYAAGKK
jgi:hypothetical protein